VKESEKVGQSLFADLSFIFVRVLAATFGYLQWLAFENVSVHCDQT
jgi:hypothetical protein